MQLATRELRRVWINETSKLSNAPNRWYVPLWSIVSDDVDIDGSAADTAPMATAVLYTATGYRDLMDPIILRLHNLCRVNCGLHNQAPMVGAAVLS
ncbi:hypothetical protein PI125_g15538 [Phytophthora idaei]|nr:hypothetical protein PI125_g15538 [Phytophthora idaei]